MESFLKFWFVVAGLLFPDGFCFFAGVVPESQSQVEEEGALRPDAAGPDTFLYCLRAASTNSA